MTQHLSARFSVTAFEPRELEGLGDWIGAVTMRKDFTGGIIGSSVAHFVSSGDEQNGRGYLAIERITGRRETEPADVASGGSFTVHHGALQRPGDPSSFGYIVPGTGTGAFAGMSGAATIEHDDDGPYFVFTLG